jgi:phytoene dehydrogenase-like protein
MCAWDHLKDRFADPLLAAFFASRGIEGGHLGPWSAGTAALLLLRECAATPGVLGGPAAFTDALVAAARAHEVELVTDAEVRAIRMDGARVAGVETADGRAFDASLVMSTVGVVQTFVGLLPRSACPVRVRTAAAAVRRRGSTAAVRLALSAPLRWRGIPQGVDGVIEFARTAPDMRALEQAFDCVKHRRWCDVPWLDVAVPSIARPALAPTGHASVSVLVHCASAELEGGWSAAHGERLRASVVDQLGRLTDGLADSIVGHEVLTPPELGDRYGLDGAHPMHAELDLAQLWAQRPSIRFARYDTPVPGLYLGGRATHPGADFPGTSGWLAAGAALADGR